MNLHEKHVIRKKRQDTWEPSYYGKVNATVRKRLQLPTGYTNDNDSYVDKTELRGYNTPIQNEFHDQKPVTREFTFNQDDEIAWDEVGRNNEQSIPQHLSNNPISPIVVIKKQYESSLAKMKEEMEEKMQKRLEDEFFVRLVFWS